MRVVIFNHKVNCSHLRFPKELVYRDPLRAVAVRDPILTVTRKAGQKAIGAIRQCHLVTDLAINVGRPSNRNWFTIGLDSALLSMLSS